MSVSHSASVFFGTDETTGVTISNNSTNTGSEIDVLGNNTSQGRYKVFLKYTGTAAAGSLDISVFDSRVTGQSYSSQAALFNSFVPINGTEKLPVGTNLASRYVTGQVKNNAVGASVTNATMGFELFQES